MSDEVPNQLKITIEIAKAMNGSSARDCLAAMTIILTELFASSSSNEEAAALFMQFVSDVGHLMENRLNASECGWQQTRQ